MKDGSYPSHRSRVYGVASQCRTPRRTVPHSARAHSARDGECAHSHTFTSLWRRNAPTDGQGREAALWPTSSRQRQKKQVQAAWRLDGWPASKVAKAATAAGAETAPPPPRPRKVSGPSGRKRVLEPQVLSDHPANVAQRKRRRKTPPTRGAPSSCSMVSKPPRSSRRPRGRPRRRERRRRIGPLPLPSLGAAMMERVRQWSGRCASAQAGATVGHSCGAG